jgi:osmotically inducible lipoprotein OsmB
MTKSFLVTLLLLSTLAACGTDPGERALTGGGIGAGAGAVGGALLGHPLIGALIGGAAGAATGAATSPHQIDLDR